MRAGTSTDDYLFIGNQRWTILDSSPNTCLMCGVCSGAGIYWPRRYGLRNMLFQSSFQLCGSRLLFTTVTPDRWHLNIKGMYDGFTKGKLEDVPIPYTGWLLLVRGFFRASLADLPLAESVMELRFEKGTLVEQVDADTVPASMLAELPEGYDSLFGHKNMQERIVELASRYLKGRYHSMTPDSEGVSKSELWGYFSKESKRDYSCATCKLFNEHGIIPLKTSMRRKYNVPYHLLPSSYSDAIERDKARHSKKTTKTRSQEGRYGN